MQCGHAHGLLEFLPQNGHVLRVIPMSVRAAWHRPGCIALGVSRRNEPSLAGIGRYSAILLASKRDPSPNVNGLA